MPGTTGAAVVDLVWIIYRGGGLHHTSFAGCLLRRPVQFASNSASTASHGKGCTHSSFTEVDSRVGGKEARRQGGKEGTRKRIWGVGKVGTQLLLGRW